MIIIDRIENEFAVCEFDERIIKNIPLSKLPKDIKEGDILKFENNIYTKDLDLIKKRKEKIEKLINKLWD